MLCVAQLLQQRDARYVKCSNADCRSATFLRAQVSHKQHCRVAVSHKQHHQVAEPQTAPQRRCNTQHYIPSDAPLLDTLLWVARRHRAELDIRPKLLSDDKELAAQGKKWHYGEEGRLSQIENLKHFFDELAGLQGGLSISKFRQVP